MADIHGNVGAFKAVWSILERTVDQTLFIGDLAGYYPFVKECLDLWDSTKIISVRGNHDEICIAGLDRGRIQDPAYRARHGTAIERSWALMSEANIALMRSWPETCRLQFGGVSVLMCHGSPWDPLRGRIYPDFSEWQRFEAYDDQIILLGQTHRPMTKRCGGKMIINPGSVGQPRDQLGGASYAILDVDRREVTHFRVPYDVAPVVEDARAHDPELPALVDLLIHGRSGG